MEIINQDEYYMSIAILTSHMSGDTNTQVGACIVSEDGQILGTGYNDFMAKGKSDKLYPNVRDGEWIDTKYPYICHAELMAIVNTCDKNKLYNSTMYVTLFPCNECAKLIVQFGIKNVVWLDDKYHDTPSSTASRRILTNEGVQTKQFQTCKDSLNIRFNKVNNNCGVVSVPNIKINDKLVQLKDPIIFKIEHVENNETGTLILRNDNLDLCIEIVDDKIDNDKLLDIIHESMMGNHGSSESYSKRIINTYA